MEGFAGKVAIITGAGRGIGKALALSLSESGAKLILNDLDPEPLSETVDSAKGEAIGVSGSVSNPEIGLLLTKTAIEKFGTIDLVATLAGYTWDVMFHRMNREQWDDIINVHLNGTYSVIQPAYSAMRKEAAIEKESEIELKPRRILTVSSMSAFGNLGQGNYSAAKAGIVGLSRTIAIEGARFNILSNSIAFGPIDTRLTRPRETQNEWVGDSVQGIPEEARAKYFATLPLGRPGTVSEAVGPMLFLLSPYANYISGALLEVNGAAHIS